jgi:hypothetical protein
MYNDVKTFIEACDQERNTENSILYHNLIKEEYQEYLDSVDSVDELDACMDMIWVILGYCYMQGYDVDGAWKEVARSNLAKIDPDTGKAIGSSEERLGIAEITDVQSSFSKAKSVIGFAIPAQTRDIVRISTADDLNAYPKSKLKPRR